MKKLIIALALVGISSTSFAQDLICDAKYKIPLDKGMNKVLVSDLGDQFSITLLKNGAKVGSPKISPALNEKGFGENGPYSFMKFANGYVFAQYNDTNHVVAKNCKPVAAQVASANDDHGSEFVERGDIAKPEFKGANTFIGDAYDPDGNFVAKVILNRAENGDITVMSEGINRGVFKRDPDLENKNGTYSEYRLETGFTVSEKESYIVRNTKVV